MNKHAPIRIRFDLTISNKTIGFERLHSELSDIAKQSDPAEVASNQKQHLLQILHAYSNSGRTFESASGFRTPEQAQQIASKRSEPTLPPTEPVAAHAATSQESNVTATASTHSLVEKQSSTGAEFDTEFKSAAKRNADGSVSFGKLVID